MSKSNCRAGVLASALVLGAASLALAADEKPNVVFILADNIGYGDLGPYGGGELRGAPTPRIDQLAHEGLKLTQFLVEPACTPSRGGPIDRAILDPQRPVADPQSKVREHAFGASLHARRHVPRPRLWRDNLGGNGASIRMRRSSRVWA